MQRSDGTGSAGRDPLGDSVVADRRGRAGDPALRRQKRREWYLCLGDCTTINGRDCQMIVTRLSRQRLTAGTDFHHNAAASSARRPVHQRISDPATSSDLLHARFQQARQNWSMTDQRRRCLSAASLRNWRDTEINLAPICPDDFGSASYISSPP